MNAYDERACTAHFLEQSYVAETFTHTNGLTYTALRCPVCHRPQGLRLVRKNQSRSIT